MGQRPNKLSSSILSGDDEHQFGTPIGFLDSGLPVYGVCGGDGDEDDDDDDDSTRGATVPIARFLKVQNRMRNADRRANAAETRVAELEPVAARVPELEKQVEDGKAVLKKLRIDNAFLTSDVEWVDAEAALRLVDLSDVEIKDDGTVKGLTEALAALAEKKPYLVKPKDDDKSKGKKGKGKRQDEEDDDDDLDDDDDTDGDDDEDEDDDDEQDDDEDTEPVSGRKVKQPSASGGASGTSTGSGKRRRKSKGPTDDELMRKYRI